VGGGFRGGPFKGRGGRAPGFGGLLFQIGGGRGITPVIFWGGEPFGETPPLGGGPRALREKIFFPFFSGFFFFSLFFPRQGPPPPAKTFKLEITGGEHFVFF